MRVLYFILAIILTSSVSKPVEQQTIIEIPTKEVVLEIPTPKVELKITKPTRDLTPLIEALIWVESRGKENAYCKREDAVGVLQIRPIMLKEVNRVLSMNGSDLVYTLEDRWDREKSIEMFEIIANHYHETSSYEKIARCWNGGPKGLQKKQTKKYWRKVQKRLHKNENSSNWEPEV